MLLSLTGSGSSVEFAAEGSTGPELLQFMCLEGEGFVWSEGALREVFSLPFSSKGGVAKFSISGEDFVRGGEESVVFELSAEFPTEVSV